jgi:hypothetical protein
MTRHILEDSEVVDYADHHSGTVSIVAGTSTRTRSASSSSATSRIAGTRDSSEGVDGVRGRRGQA